MEIRVLKTFEITPDQWEEIVYGFNKSFETQKNVKTFKEYYQRTRLGYSFHSLAFSDSGELSGYNSIIPVLYNDKEGVDILIGISGGTFVVREYRKDIFITLDMASALWEYVSKENVIAILGVSNQNSFQYALKFLDSTLISFLPYYGLPVRIFNVLKLNKLSILNFISVFSTGIIIGLNIILSKAFKLSENETRFELKSDEQFLQNRFGTDNYHEIRKNDTRAFYRVVSEDGVNTVYLFDFGENNKRTYRSLVTVIRYLLDTEKPDLILFIGHLRLPQFLLFRIPRKFEPQPLPLTFNITSESFGKYYEAMSLESNWNFGLMNFDAR